MAPWHGCGVGQAVIGGEARVEVDEGARARVRPTTSKWAIQSPTAHASTNRAMVMPTQLRSALARAFMSMSDVSAVPEVQEDEEDDADCGIHSAAMDTLTKKSPRFFVVNHPPQPNASMSRGPWTNGNPAPTDRWRCRSMALEGPIAVSPQRRWSLSLSPIPECDPPPAVQ